MSSVSSSSHPWHCSKDNKHCKLNEIENDLRTKYQRSWKRTRKKIRLDTVADLREGPRGGGGRAPFILLRKEFFGGPPPPYLRVWIRHCDRESNPDHYDDWKECSVHWANQATWRASHCELFYWGNFKAWMAHRLSEIKEKNILRCWLLSSARYFFLVLWMKS